MNQAQCLLRLITNFPKSTNRQAANVTHRLLFNFNSVIVSSNATQIEWNIWSLCHHNEPAWLYVYWIIDLWLDTNRPFSLRSIDEHSLSLLMGELSISMLRHPKGVLQRVYYITRLEILNVIACIATALQTNTTMRTLNISWCDISAL